MKGLQREEGTEDNAATAPESKIPYRPRILSTVIQELDSETRNKRERGEEGGKKKKNKGKNVFTV